MPGHSCQCSNDSNAVSAGDMAVTTVSSSTESDSSISTSSECSSSSSTDTDSSSAFVEAPIDTPTTSGSSTSGSESFNYVNVGIPEAHLSNASMRGPRVNLTLDAARSSTAAPMSLAMDTPGPSLEGSPATSRTSSPTDESVPEQEITNASRVALPSVTPESSDSPSESSSIQPSKIGTTKSESDLVRQARLTLEDLLGDLPRTTIPPGRLPVSLRPTETDSERPLWKPSQHDSVRIEDQQVNIFFRAIDNPNDLPSSDANITAGENSTNSRRSCLAETGTGAGSRSNPDHSGRGPQNNLPEIVCVPGFSPSYELGFSIPHVYRSSNGRNRGLPSMNLSLEGIDSALVVLDSHIGYFAKALINHCTNYLNHSREAFEIFCLGYETFKEDEYGKFSKLITFCRAVLEKADSLVTQNLCTKLKRIDGWLSKLNYAYFLMRMHHQYRPKCKETKMRIAALEKTVRSIKEWRKPRFYDSSDSAENSS